MHLVRSAFGGGSAHPREAQVTCHGCCNVLVTCLMYCFGKKNILSCREQHDSMTEEYFTVEPVLFTLSLCFSLTLSVTACHSLSLSLTPSLSHSLALGHLLLLLLKGR